jgi:hypothetical protein
VLAGASANAGSLPPARGSQLAIRALERAFRNLATSIVANKKQKLQDRY